MTRCLVELSATEILSSNDGFRRALDAHVFRSCRTCAQLSQPVPTYLKQLKLFCFRLRRILIDSMKHQMEVGCVADPSFGPRY
jgi:hypothetical protein